MARINVLAEVAKGIKANIYAVDNLSPVSRVAVYVKAGSRFEPDATPGISHYISASAGLTTQDSSIFGITRHAERAGASFKVNLDREHIIYSITCLRDKLDYVLGFIDDTLHKPEFRAWELFDHVHPRLKEEVMKYKANQQLVAHEAMHKSAFRGGLAHSKFIPEHQIDQIKNEHLFEYLHNNFVLERMSFVGLGVDGNELTSKIEENFKLNGDAYKGVSGASRYVGGESRIQANFPQTLVSFVVEGSPIGDLKSNAALEVIGAVLGGHDQKFLKYGEGPSKSVSKVLASQSSGFKSWVVNVNYEDTGLFGLSMVGPNELLHKATKNVVGHVRKVLTNFGEEDLKAGKRAAKARALIESENHEAVFSAMGKLYSAGIVGQSAIDQVDKLSLKEVQKVIGNLLKSKPTLVAVGNPRYVPYVDELVELNIEERLLQILTDRNQLENDIVSRFIPDRLINYISLCQLFIGLAANKRRPTPLLRQASISLCGMTLSKDTSKNPSVDTLIATLNALVALSYPNRPLMQKLINDLTETISLDRLDSTTLCSLLRSIGSLRWRPLPLLDKFYCFVTQKLKDCAGVDHNVIIALLHVTALLNYRPNYELKEFHRHCIGAKLEHSIDKKSRKWMNYVCSLVALNLAEESHFKSILNDQFMETMEDLSGNQIVNHGDSMKLLNLFALAKFEMKLKDITCERLVFLSREKVQRSVAMQKLSSKIHEALNGFINSTDQSREDIHTPFGFAIDCEIHLDENLNLLPLTGSPSFEHVVQLVESGLSPAYSSDHRCAIIYTLFKDTIANCPTEVVGYKNIVARILNNFGYKTIFLPESLVDREKTSADLTNKIQEIIKDSIAR